MKPIRAALPALLRDPSTGEQFEQVTSFTPRRDENGAIIGHEEPRPPGYTDLRSRGTNPGSGGVTVIVNPPADR